MATWLLQATIIANRFFALHWLGSPLFHSYQYITYMFLHGGFGHLFFNMFALWMFGRTLEYELGSRRFIIYYLVCGVGAALIQMLVAWLTGKLDIELIGASGEYPESGVYEAGSRVCV